MRTSGKRVGLEPLIRHDHTGEDLLEAWLQFCLELCVKPRLITSGSRKIFRGIQLDIDSLDDSLKMEHGMYFSGSGMKLNALRRYYWNAESINKAIADYPEWVNKRKYGSVGITTHGQQKGGFTKQGFCIQSIVFSYYPKFGTHVDVYYRTTEVVKKFLADLVFLREMLVPKFEPYFDKAPLNSIRFHFANLTLHPMFYWMLIPHLEWDEWVEQMERMKKEDNYFYISALRWCRQYMRDRVTPFAQAQKSADCMKRTLTKRQMQHLRKHIRDSIGENSPRWQKGEEE